MYDHISIGVNDLDRATAFYDATLAPLGIVRLRKGLRGAEYGPEGFQGEAPFAIVRNESQSSPPATGFHIAFIARSREAVDGFHRAALLAGGGDDGPPGIRANYDAGYYAAFVRDLDGHRLEAVIHEKAP